MAPVVILCARAVETNAPAGTEAATASTAIQRCMLMCGELEVGKTVQQSMRLTASHAPVMNEATRTIHANDRVWLSWAADAGVVLVE